MNAVEIEEAISQLADQPFDPKSFPYAFLEAFGNKETTIKRLRAALAGDPGTPAGSACNEAPDGAGHPVVRETEVGAA